MLVYNFKKRKIVESNPKEIDALIDIGKILDINFKEVYNKIQLCINNILNNIEINKSIYFHINFITKENLQDIDREYLSEYIISCIMKYYETKEKTQEPILNINTEGLNCGKTALLALLNSNLKFEELGLDISFNNKNIIKLIEV